MKKKKNFIPILIGIAILMVVLTVSAMIKVNLTNKEYVNKLYKTAVFDKHVNKERWYQQYKNTVILTNAKMNKVAKQANKHAFIQQNKPLLKSHVLNSKPKQKELYGYDALILPNFSNDKSQGKARFNKYIYKSRKIIYRAASKKSGLIIDLRNNLGGSSEAMILAISPFEQNNKALLYEQINGINHSIELSAKKSNKGTTLFYKANANNLTVKDDFHSVTVLKDKKLMKTKIAVLINNNTASAAEYVLLALKGNKNVKVFGAPTAGYTSSNTNYKKMTYPAGWLVDANKQKIYRNDPIQPDVNGVNKKNIKKWLNN
ncbi:hypothetical protein FHQ08_09635 [Lactobacillus sp. CC-MHH1034]|uniref:S41 family peptidase n=1 Tax=Agrilactobacillus fermenti TaxID=2586909 RepID=UPI001E4F74FC|nr:S41 family peptidase [Agrilactobacillus fermenti]MCD2256984.1 hypothetical protein [Agrilactobacillus fermenti]